MNISKYQIKLDDIVWSLQICKEPIYFN